ncbi:semaphorin-1A-like isoform X2 [Antedon mediterranea]|uniref:semaphorin-1A-like isoform X2 n=1 Tax=Antedon mediterranea TaxID=105859 RepID=UPI003AF62A66
MDTIERISSIFSMRLLILSTLWIIMSNCLNVVSSMTMKDQTPSASGFGKKYFKNLTSSTVRNTNLTHITQIQILPDWPAMLIGANNSLYIFNLNHELDIASSKKLEWVPDSRSKTMCLIKGKSEDDCQNYIKVIAPDKVNGRLLICGTYAQKPTCLNLQVDMSNIESQWERKESNVSDGLLKCPFNKDQKNTALFADGSLYAGTVADFNERESVLTRSLGNAELYPELVTKQSDSVWLNFPEFIKSYQEGNEVFFFFREISIETQYTGKMYYSRVARVCTNDNGHDVTWTTFLKARLDCSFHGDFPFYFNYLQDIVRVVEENKVFYYGIFTTGEHEIPGSAVCRFSLDEIQENFKTGLFKQTTAPWQQVPIDSVPPNRPGNCASDSTQLTNQELNFIKTHPLLYNPVMNYGQDDPLFTLTRSNYRLQKLVTTKKGPYTIVFAGTDDGHIMKLVLRENHPGSSKVSPVLLYNMHVMENRHAITNMRLYKNSDGEEVLFVTSKDVVVELSLQHCQYLKNCSCKQDPYCEWIESSNKCIVSTNEDYSGVELDCTVDSTFNNCTYQGTVPDDITTIVTTPSAASTTTVVPTTTSLPEPAKLGTPYRQTTNIETTHTRQESGNEMRILEGSDWPTEKLVHTLNPTEKPLKLEDDEVKSGTSKQSSMEDPSTTLIILAIVGWAICFIEMAGVVCWCLMRKNKGKYEVSSLTEPDQSVKIVKASSSMEKIHRNAHSPSYTEPPSYASSPQNTLNKHTANGRRVPNGKQYPNGKPPIDTSEIHEVKKRLSQHSTGRSRSATLEHLKKININGHVTCSNYEGFSDTSDGPSPTQSTMESPPTYSQSFEEDITSLVLEMEPHIKRISSVEV